MFAYMHDQGILYGFNIFIGELRATIPSLWRTTVEWARRRRQQDPAYNPEMLRLFSNPVGDINRVTADALGGHHNWLSTLFNINGDDDYNLCHFWSNFELGSLNWLRSPAYLDYFNHLDRAGEDFADNVGDAAGFGDFTQDFGAAEDQEHRQGECRGRVAHFHSFRVRDRTKGSRMDGDSR